VRIITWNVARRRARLAEQADALGGRRPDVIALQEVTSATLPLWRAACQTLGFESVCASLDLADPARQPAARRRTGVLVAARTTLTSSSLTLSVPWPESALAVAAADGRGSVEVHCVHVPNAANGEIKVRTLVAIRQALEAAPPTTARILCGDLNTPRRELPDGEVISFARDSKGRLRPERGPKWDAAELGVVPGLRELGFRDAFRFLNGYDRREPSWTWRQVAGHGGGWRLDHLFTSAGLLPIASTYHHEWRDRGLSDHSALEVDVTPSGE
jgi:exonuclease III